MPIYLLSEDTLVIVGGFVAIGLFAGGGMYGQIPAFLNERYPTEVRATASAFSYHVGAIAGGLVPPLLTYFATNPSWNLGFAIPMLIGAMFGLVNFIVALALGPETREVPRWSPTSSSPDRPETQNALRPLVRRRASLCVSDYSQTLMVFIPASASVRVV